MQTLSFAGFLTDPSFIVKGPAKCMPTYVKADNAGVVLYAGSSPSCCCNVLSLALLHVGQLLMINFKCAFTPSMK